MKRLTTFFLVYLLAFITNAQEIPTKGDGSIANPYLIENLNQLKWLSEGDTDISDETRWSMHYQLVSDIDATDTKNWNEGLGYRPIGNSTNPFNGSFNGNDFTISNLYSNRPSERYIGLFGFCNAALIENIQLVNVELVCERFAGALAGKIENTTKVEHIVASGQVSGQRGIGGVFGEINFTSEANYILSFTNVEVVEGEKNVGGVTGVFYNNSFIRHAYAVGTVKGASDIGPIVGAGHLANADKLCVIENSYWDKETTGLTTQEAVEDERGLTTAQFSDATNFPDWDFDQVFEVATHSYDSQQRPYFKWLNQVRLLVYNPQTNVGSTTGQGRYTKNEVVELAAIPNSASVEFSHWIHQEEEVSTLPTIEVTMDQPKLYQPLFEATTYIITTSPSQRGTIIPETAEVTEDSEVTFTITPNLGYEIKEVLINGESIGAVYDFSLSGITQDTHIEMLFDPIAYSIPEGEGTETNPYLISTLEELRWVSEGDTTSEVGEGQRWRYYFQLIRNIDVADSKNWHAGKGFKPLGNLDKPFRGHFDGQGYTLENIFINKPSERYLGVFGYGSEGASIKNMKVQNIDITGDRYLGGLIGKADNMIIEHVSAEGELKGARILGGIVGDLNQGAQLSYATSFVDILIPDDERNTGGIAGTAYNSATIAQSYAVGLVTGGSNTGGIVGNGHSNIVVTNSYWDKETTGQTRSHNSEDTFGKSTSEFENESTFAGWDFTSTWRIITNEECDEHPRPYLSMHYLTKVMAYANRSHWGTVNGNGAYESGEEVRLQAAANNGFYFIEWQKGGEFLTDSQNVTITVGENDEHFVAVFGATQYEIDVEHSENGKVVPGSTVVNHLDDITFQFIPDEGYDVDYAIINNDTIRGIYEYTFQAVTHGHVIFVQFKEYEPFIYTIPAIAGDGGSIAPELGRVEEGQDIEFIITPIAGYIVEDVFVNGQSMGPLTSYVFEEVWDNHTISASFRRDDINSIDDRIGYIKAYPNPVQSRLTLEVKNQSRIQLVDVYGRVMIDQEYPIGTHQMDLSKCTNGIYLLIVDGQYYTKIKKF
ncbi:T9SS type A sorting domain-containing protein [Flammeovirga yaeyamensis]|uniref:T9SS type A sorting domain-containing protein n=1 Tax=Flammeovirga yaeyamensis TaxID=367791 RepID=A0AAX1NCC4_9BACT|nr:T9SS type A sorting domain-containing protein [Flammeovirga yaeyamensis]MBB3696903.1 hypothetical protein [Flammeovirga yaeyamensis]NMF33567.1 T9SS type A sorting domain-containing protein [Flammeovirga yaeyamensis]QWG05164.1 T9SS type A sorting domain-containing protein [Flammeovirga yaeyamensis]